MTLTLTSLLELTEGTLSAASQEKHCAELTGYATLAEATPQQVSFLGNTRYESDAKISQAGVILAPKGQSVELGQSIVILCENPMVAFDLVMRHFTQPAAPFRPGIHPTAFVSPEAKVDPNKVQIGPNTTVEAGAVIAEGTQIAANVYIGHGVHIGKDCFLSPGCVVMHECILHDRVRLQPGVVLGGDGYGYEFYRGQHVKMLQAGNVEIESDVEIGSNTTIDRARVGKTLIRQGTKIDNLVQIAHGAEIGQKCLIVAQTGIAGSTKLGAGVIAAAQVGIAGHLDIAAGSILLGRAGVTKSITQAGKYMGYPAEPAANAKKDYIRQRRLPELLERVEQLEAALAALQTQISDVEANCS